MAGSAYTERFSEQAAVLDTLYPVSTSSANNGAWVSVGKYARVIAKLDVGLIAATGTLDFKLQQAQDGSGTGVKDITGKAITQLVATDDNVKRWIELRMEELDVDNGFDYIRMVVTGATAASLVSAELLGFVARYEPVTQPAALVVIP